MPTSAKKRTEKQTAKKAEAAPAKAPAKAAAKKAAAPAKKAAGATASPAPTVTMLQQRLNALGYYHGVWDGRFGPLTAQAVGHFQYRNGLFPNGEPNAQTLAALGF